MAQNTTDQYRKFRYYEGVCSSKDFIKELSKVLCMGVKTNPVIDGDGNIREPAKFLKACNWDIVYPMPNVNFSKYKMIATKTDYDNNISLLSEDEIIEKINNQINQITDKVILRTTTTEVDITGSKVDDLSVSGESDQAKQTMYLQIFKPRYLANPEEYPLDAELYGLTPQLITKEMYREARKTTASVIYDLAQLVTDPERGDYSNVKFHGDHEIDPDDKGHDGLITKRSSFEYVDSVSDTYTKDELFGDNGILQGLKSIFGESTLNSVIQKPDNSNRSTYVVIPRAYLNSIQQEEIDLYEFLFGICSAKTTFTQTDYDLIDEMRLQVSFLGDESKQTGRYYVILSYKKRVEIFTIDTNRLLRVDKEYGHTALENIVPEIYSEGRYVPLPDRYLGDPDKSQVAFEGEQIQFCLDKVTDENVLYGTIVLRFDYDKNLQYTDLHSLKITDSVTLENNHYILMRLFDVPNDDFSGPKPNIFDENGNITQTWSHASPWSKLSWYQDFEEVMMDHIDEDVSVTNVTDGTLLVPLETAGLTADTRISYWINTNNDRFSLIVMGNPALDYERDRHLISSCYCGRIDSFDNSINDVSGNFALYTSSSTTPCKTSMKAYDTKYRINTDFENKYFVVDTNGKTPVLADDFPTKYPDATSLEANISAYLDHSSKIGGVFPASNIIEDDIGIYYVTLTGNKFFYEDDCPRYMLLDNNDNPIPTSNGLVYQQVLYRDFIRSTSDSRSSQMKIYIGRANGIKPAKVAFNFGYFEEKFVITSGITRDMFGNVIDIETIDDYGKNTSDGTLSVSMYHTRSKAFYQKHHFLFATTEEYMSKVMYGKSSYTGEYYADRIKITHGNDGPRGIICDTLVIDSSSLYPKDELVINKDFSKSSEDMEETFTYFPVTAPFSPLADGPNARYGLALKKAEKEPIYTDPHKILKIASNELKVRMYNYISIEKDRYLPDTTENGCKIYWEVVGDELDNDGNVIINNWIEDQNNAGSNILMSFIDGSSAAYNVRSIEAPNLYIVCDDFKAGDGSGGAPGIITDAIISKTTVKTRDFKSRVLLNTATGNNTTNLGTVVDTIYYGYSDKPLQNIPGNTTIVKIVDDKTSASGYTDSIHVYPFEEYFIDVANPLALADYTVAATGQNQGVDLKQSFELDIYNAHPDKYLNIYCVGDDLTDQVGEIIDPNNSNNNQPVYNKKLKIALSYPLHNKNYDRNDDTQCQVGSSYYDILQYPCSLVAYVIGVTNQNTQGISVNNSYYTHYEFYYHEYGTSKELLLANVNGSVDVSYSHYDKTTQLSIVTNNGQRVEIPGTEVVDDLFIKIEK